MTYDELMAELNKLTLDGEGFCLLFALCKKYLTDLPLT